MSPQTLDPAFPITAAALSSSAQDLLWISQTLAGESQAYAQLIHKYKAPLFEMTCRVLKDRCQGEDILQDAFARGYRHLNTFRHDAKFSTWMYAIVMNGLRNHLRRNKIIHWSSLDAPRKDRDDRYRGEIEHKEPPMDVMLERKMEMDVLRRLITDAPPVHRTLLTLYYFKNLTMQEIAQKTGRPLGTIKVYLHRARKRLHNDFKHHTASPRALAPTT